MYIKSTFIWQMHEKCRKKTTLMVSPAAIQISNLKLFYRTVFSLFIFPCVFVLAHQGQSNRGIKTHSWFHSCICPAQQSSLICHPCISRHHKLWGGNTHRSDISSPNLSLAGLHLHTHKHLIRPVTWKSRIAAHLHTYYLFRSYFDINAISTRWVLDAD